MWQAKRADPSNLPVDTFTPGSPSHLQATLSRTAELGMDPLVNPSATANVDPRAVAQRDRTAMHDLLPSPTITPGLPCGFIQSLFRELAGLPYVFIWIHLVVHTAR